MNEPRPNGTPADYRCGACGTKLTKRRGYAALVLAAGQLIESDVCADCADRAILLVPVDPAHQIRSVLLPYAKHLRLLASAYDLQEDKRAEGLRQAADILQTGRAVSVGLDPAVGNDETVTVTMRGHDIVDVDRDVKPPDRPDEVFDPLEPTAADGEPLGHCEMAILTVLSRRSPPIGQAELGFRACYSWASGGFAKSLARLRALQFVDGPGDALVITEKGKAAVGRVQSAPASQEILDYWTSKLGACRGSILRAAATATVLLSQEELAERAGGYSPRSGGFAKALAKLRRQKFLDGLRVHDEFLAAIR